MQKFPSNLGATSVQCSWLQRGDVKQVHYQGPTSQNPVAMVTWLPGIVHPWASPCSVCLSKGTALFFSFLSASD